MNNTLWSQVQVMIRYNVTLFIIKDFKKFSFTERMCKVHFLRHLSQLFLNWAKGVLSIAWTKWLQWEEWPECGYCWEILVIGKGKPHRWNCLIISLPTGPLLQLLLQWISIESYTCGSEVSTCDSNIFPDATRYTTREITTEAKCVGEGIT